MGQSFKILMFSFTRRRKSSHLKHFSISQASLIVGNKWVTKISVGRDKKEKMNK